MALVTPTLTATPAAPPTYNNGIAETFSWVPVEGAGRPLYAKAVYPVEIAQQLTTITNLLCAILAK